MASLQEQHVIDGLPGGRLDIEQLGDLGREAAKFAQLLFRLPKPSQLDVLELMGALRDAESDEEKREIILVLIEVFEQKPLVLRTLDVQDKKPSPGLQRWIDFVSEKILLARKTAKLTQEELAERSGLPQSHVSRLETGKHSPSDTSLNKIAKALNIDVSYFDPGREWPH